MADGKSRTPQGVRGLKYFLHFVCLDREVSHPARGAWIEMAVTVGLAILTACRTPQGVRGLKCGNDTVEI